MPATTHDHRTADAAAPADADEHGGADRGGKTHEGTSQAGMGHGGMMRVETNPAYAVTGPQLAAVTLLSLLALTAGVLFATSYANLTISANEVGAAVMPPGMIMTRETSAEAMRDMAAVDLRHLAYTAPADARGDQPLEPRLEGGVKVFELDTSMIRWNILPGVQVAAYAFNRQLPGPRIRITEGDHVRMIVTNNLPEATTVHWHGLILPNAMDGPGEITQPPIEPGQSYTYEFVARQRGTFFYHTHHHVDRQQALGLYGALIIDPRSALGPRGALGPRDPTGAPAYDQEVLIQLQEWLFRDDYTYPSMPMEGAMPNYFTINGKAYPATETVNLRVGERLLVRFIGSSSAFIHPMHIHGGPFRIVETDGYPVPEGAQWVKDTVNVGPGERYDVIWEAREPGKWLLHCHINHHTTNNNREEHGGGGLMLILEVSP
jgi:manganese oxidase